MSATAPTAAQRTKTVPGTYNFRSLDGLPTARGRIRSRALYRSDGLAALDDAGRAAFTELGIRTIWDLRGPEEIQAAPSALTGLDVRIHLGALIPGALAESATRIPTLAEMYRRILRNGGAAATGLARTIAVDAPDGAATLIHCSAGKDRTGVLTALLLDAVGVDREAITADYAVSGANLDGGWLAGMATVLAGSGVQITDEIRELALASPASAMRATLASIDAQWGGSAGYLRAHGLENEELAALTAALVDER